MGVLTGCKPRAEVLGGDLDDAIFAADFGHLIEGTAPEVYRNPAAFIQNTYPTSHLKRVVEVVFGRLSDPAEAGATLRLSTGFGGGKTHTLMALWHLARNIANPAFGTELLPAAGRPQKVRLVAVDARGAGVPIFTSHPGVQVRSLWGEVFYQLGGEPALRALGAADDAEASPSEGQLKAVLPAEPLLVLLDELVVYMAKLSERGQGNLLGFLNSLSAVVGSRKQAVLVVTDPADQAAYAKESAKLAELLEAAAKKLNEVLGRRASDFDPIGDEAPAVIVRRLFAEVDQGAAQAASATYHGLYKRVSQDPNCALPQAAAQPAYAQRIVQCYPFHPRLLETAQERLGALQDFQKSRGVLRLFARILRDVWDAKVDYELITAGEIDWSSPRIQADLLQRLNRDNFKACVSADVDRHAGELDGAAPRGVHRRVASALLLESLPMNPNSGLDRAEATLAVLRPEEGGHEPAEALDRLTGVCWHTYPLPGGRGLQFRYDPNIVKQIEERKPQVPLEDAKGRVLAEAQAYFGGPLFKLAAWPSTANQVPESAQLQLALCESEAIAKRVCQYADESNPEAPMPRLYRNAIFAVAPSATAFDAAVDRAQRLIATETIEREHAKGEDARLVREQIGRVKPEYQRQFRLQTCRAFDRVVLADGVARPLEEKYQVGEDKIMGGAQGQASLKKYLDDKQLIYQPGDALDANRFLKDVLPGAVPLADQSQVYTAKAVHERFLAAPKQRLVPDSSVVRQTILKALGEGKVVLKLTGDGRAYDAQGCVQGPAGARKRSTGTISTFALDDTVLMTPAGSEAASEWLKEDDTSGYHDRGGGRGGGGGGAPPPTKVLASTWPKVLEYAANRPLLELRLIAHSPGAGGKLAGLALPLNADGLALDVTVGGEMKDGGNINFSASNAKATAATRPLSIAQTLFNGLADGGTYEAVLTLGFSAAGRSDLGGQLQMLAEAAGNDVEPSALFDRPTGGAA